MTEKTKIISITAMVSRCILAAVFFYGGIPKLLNIDAFAGIVDAYGITPDFLVYPVALIIPLLEVVSAVGLLLARTWSLIITVLLFAIFIFVLSYGILIGLDIDCGCFAPSDPEFHAFSSLREALIRDLILLIPVGVAIWHQKQKYNMKKIKERTQ